MNYQFGSLNQMRLMAKNYHDIIELYKSDDNFGELIIVCKPNYNKKKINEFMDDNVPINVYVKIEIQS